MKHFSVIDLTDHDAFGRLQRASGPGQPPRWYNGITLRLGRKLYIWTRAAQ
jgi:hypothetical protein